jgi:GTP-binding protein
LLEADPFLGRISPAASTPAGQAEPAVKVLRRDGKLVENGRVSKMLAFRGLERVSRSRRPKAGDIVAIAGLTKATVADTLCDPT